MIKLYKNGIYLHNGKDIYEDKNLLTKKTGINPDEKTAKKGTISYSILEKHNTVDDMENLKLKFDSMTSHDITYVGIIQTARASGMTQFPMPYVMTNCHNSLCAVGGTINEDDHMFAHSAAQKYGGIYVPTNMAVIHSYNREMMAGCEKMILGSDSHTRYGALGTIAIGEGGGELAKQLVGRTYDVQMPEVVAVYLDGKPQVGVGPQDVALSIIGEVYENGFVKNKIMEFVGPGVKNLPIEYRHGIDVMTTETTCLSSVWITDIETKDYLTMHARPQDYKELNPAETTYYAACIYVDLSTISPTIAMPMHPSYTYTIKELKENASDILNLVEKRANEQIAKTAKLDLMSKLRDGYIYVDQGIVAGCSGGTFDNIVAVSDILNNQSCGNGAFTMSVYPGSMPTYLELLKNGSLTKIISSGAIVRECFCGPCFGAGDTPANGEFSIRHTTRNFPNREGSKPGEGQMSGVALMDARSIAATAINGGKLTAATELDINYTTPKYYFDKTVYDKRILNKFGQKDDSKELVMGPNIKDWPQQPQLSDDLVIKVVSYITDPVTTTDELIPSGEASSYRSNPLRLAEFTLSRKDPMYVGKAKDVNEIEQARKMGEIKSELADVYSVLKSNNIQVDEKKTVVGSTIFAMRPGDGSAREQAASCQRVLGAAANIAVEYATKRYRSNCINWGISPFLIENPNDIALDDWIFIPKLRQAIIEEKYEIQAFVIRNGQISKTNLKLGNLTTDERKIIIEGCLINYYKNN